MTSFFITLKPAFLAYSKFREPRMNATSLDTFYDDVVAQFDKSSTRINPYNLEQSDDPNNRTVFDFGTFPRWTLAFKYSLSRLFSLSRGLFAS